MSLYPKKVNAGYVQVTEKQIKTRFYADSFVITANNSKYYNRLGLGYGYRNKQYEFHIGIHDNLFPYSEISYKAEHIKTIFNLYVETDDTEEDPDLVYGVGATYLFSESFGAYVGLEKSTWLIGVRKWF